MTACGAGIWKTYEIAYVERLQRRVKELKLAVEAIEADNEQCARLYSINSNKFLKSGREQMT